MGWSRFLRRGRWDAERARELESHLEIETDENIARGMAPAEARYAAQRKLGNSLRIREEIYRMNTIGWLDTLWQDLRFGLRLLRRTPGFTCVAVLSLTLGIGANTAIFQLLDAVRLRALPVKEPGELVEVRLADPGRRAGNVVARYAQLTGPQWERLRADQQAFSSMLAWSPTRLNLARGGEVRNAQGIFVSGTFFEVLGVAAARGRVLGAADDLRGCGSRAAVISHAFWQREYGGDPTVVGRPIHLEGHPFDIVGVTPEGFFGVEVGRMFDVAVPICAASEIGGEPGLLEDGFTWWLSAVGRLRPGWSAGRASAHLRTLSPALFKATLPKQLEPEQADRYLKFQLDAAACGGGFSALRTRYETPLWLLLGLSALVLFTACANIANLLLARAGARKREIAVRLATGASRGRLVRQLLSESLLLATLGAALGAVLAQVISATLVSFLSTGRDPLFVSLTPDWRLLGFAAATALATTMLFGLLPALRGTSAPLEAVMRSSGRGLTSNRGRLGWQRALVVAQVALSLVMVTGALLFAASLRNLTGLDTGFSPDDMVVADVDFSRVGVPADRHPALHRELLDRVRSVAGVISAAQVGIVPISGWSSEDELRLEGHPETRMPTKLNGVGGRYFETMRTPLVAGRDFGDRDVVGSPLVVIVNQSFARRYFGRAPALGQRLLLHTGSHQWSAAEIVGVVADTTYDDLRSPFQPIVYRASAQDPEPGSGLSVVVRSGLSLATLRSAIAKAVTERSPAMSVSFQAYPTMVRDTLLRERLMATLSGLFGVLALVLSATGIYGVLSYLVVRRRQEIGLRLALGATRSAIVRMVAGQSLGWVGAGLGAGVLLAVLAATAARSMLFGLAPTNPVALVAAAATLAATGAIATVIPALRAARSHPTSALRED
jgi:putative ABC transport system permease protein